ncbi:cytochrome P450 sterol C22-desaturase [Dacryopinax primogenitus]|uniref:sterol 22-desaturase n=1 Tax=Dacryopinax primogenitus (strain DJM 731) TaxID=1858805 RepID=M5G4Z0_DACPD|nr:cytochrome P450 sterol C22-desaturase [Dacryopinax primogenitus]EJU00917.1 cytochrome P450 sterol C22-desaturase [Dacryopinax primogenitus]
MASHSASLPTAQSSPLSFLDIPLSLPFSLSAVTTPNIWASIALIVLSLLVLEQTVWRTKRKFLPGDTWTIPVIGQFVNSLYPSLENYQKQWALGPLSATSVFNIFIVIASANELTRKIFNSGAYAEPMLVAAARPILMEDNWVFLNGKVHIEYRRMLNQFFTRKSLSLYLGLQDTIAREHFAFWLKDSSKEAQSVMTPMRYFNMATSLRVFCGRYIDPEQAKLISDKYWLITKALELVNFPLHLPGTKVYNAIQARKVAMVFLLKAARESKVHMRAGGEPGCFMDAWCQEMFATGKEFSEKEMAQVVLAFLFASQDAMSSGLIYAFQHLADHPAVLAKVREEQERIRGGDFDRPITLEELDACTYLRATVKESLRLKPPVLMVPYKVTQPFPISPDYTVPAGSMVVPSVYPSCHDPSVYPSPSSFLPERWLDPNGTAEQNPKNYLIFGAGAHRCIGYEYALMHIAMVIGTASGLMDWEHKKTEDSEKVEIIATIFPKDGCLLKFTPRKRS